MLPKIVYADFLDLRTVNEHERDLLVPKTKASRYVVVILDTHPMHKPEKEFVRETINWK